MAVRVREDRGAWWVFIAYRGQRTKRRLGPGVAGKAAAQDVARRVGAQLALDDVSVFERRDDTTVTLQAYAERWLLTVQGRKKAGTYAAYASVLRQHWLPTFGGVALRALRREALKGTVAGWLSDGSRSKSARQRVAILGTCLESAVEDGHLTVNPCKGLRKFAAKSGEAPAMIEVFTNLELREILHVAEEPMRTIVLVLARTGLRLGEALTLQWADLCLGDRRYLTVRRTWGGGSATVINTPKGDREREVDLSAQAVGALWTQRDRVGRGEWVFPEGDGPTKKRGFQHAWVALLAKAGVRYRKAHTLRHTFATRLIEQGESLPYVQQQLGHQSIQITVDIYGHLQRGTNRRAVDKLDDVGVA